MVWGFIEAKTALENENKPWVIIIIVHSGHLVDWSSKLLHVYKILLFWPAEFKKLPNASLAPNLIKLPRLISVAVRKFSKRCYFHPYAEQRKSRRSEVSRYYLMFIFHLSPAEQEVAEVGHGSISYVSIPVTTRNLHKRGQDQNPTGDVKTTP